MYGDTFDSPFVFFLALLASKLMSCPAVRLASVRMSVLAFFAAISHSSVTSLNSLYQTNVNTLSDLKIWTKDKKKKSV